MVLFGDTVPLVVTNNCSEAIWPAIGTQAGTGPGTGGFELGAGLAKALEVSHDWAGRVWGRTNCSFNADGTAPANATSGRPACLTGDCSGRLDCASSGAPPATLAEFTLAGGARGDRNFYDLSLVDGYNLPLGLEYLPGPNTTAVPPSLANPACVATAGYLAAPARVGTDYTNASFPRPLEPTRDNANIRRWCPWPLQALPPPKPGGGVFPLPDDHIPRPVFDPCLSACARTGRPADCCTGPGHDTPGRCRPGLYARRAKAACPDAYSYAFDDGASTFAVPRGGGWRVVFCPAGRSTDIQATLAPQLAALAAAGALDPRALRDLGNVSYIEAQRGAAAAGRGAAPASLRRVVAAALVVALALLC